MIQFRDKNFGGVMGTLIRPFGIFLKLLYDLTGNYGWALIIFTVIVNLLLMPLSIKQQKSTMAMQKIQPKMNEIQKKYQYDKEKQSQEMMKLYQEYNINPMSGCLPLLIQFPIIIILYQAVLKPLTYMFGESNGFTPEVIESLMKKAGTIIGKPVTSEIQIFSVVDKLGDLWPQGVEIMNFDFFGLSLNQTPNFAVPSLLWIIPIVCVLTTYLSSAIMTNQNKQNSNAAANQTADSMKTMQMFMPLMTGFFAFTLPAALGFYWTIGNIVRLLQQLYLNNRFKKLSEAEEQEKLNAGTVHPSKKKKGNKK